MNIKMLPGGNVNMWMAENCLGFQFFNSNSEYTHYEADRVLQVDRRANTNVATSRAITV